MDEATSTEPILYEGIEKVKQFLGDLLKVETIVHQCLLASLREVFYLIFT